MYLQGRNELGAREQTCACRGDEGPRATGGSLGLADTDYYREWVSSEVLLYTTGSYFQYPGINYNEKEHKKEFICVCNRTSQRYSRS